MKENKEKNTNRLFTLLALILLAAFAFMTIRSFSEISYSPEVPDKNKYKYHFQVFVQNQDKRFEDELRRGIEDASREYDICTEVIKYNDYSENEIYDAVMCAVYSDVDGVAFQPYNVSNLMPAINKAREDGINVVFYSDDSLSFADIPVIGSNYDIGKKAAEMYVSSGAGNRGKTAVILSGYQEREELRTKGISDVFEKYPGINIDYTYYVASAFLKVDKMVSEILEKCPDLSGIICLDEKNAPIIAGNLINLNKINDITIVSYGLAKQTLKYIDDGVIYGTVADDAYMTGKAVISKLYSDVSGDNVNIPGISIDTVQEQVDR